MTHLSPRSPLEAPHHPRRHRFLPSRCRTVPRRPSNLLHARRPGQVSAFHLEHFLGFQQSPPLQLRVFLRNRQIILIASYFRDTISITKRYFPSLLSSRSYASLTF